MCECCKNVSTGNDYNPIIEGKISMGFSDNSFEKKTKINYCPVCGRNFNES